MGLPGRRTSLPVARRPTAGLRKTHARDIYLPEGIWYEYWTGKRYGGPQWTTETYDMEKIPFFIRGGSILPLGKAVQSTEEIDYKSFTLKIYPDSDGRAGYQIVDGKQSISMHAFLEENTVNINIEPEPPALFVEIPGEAGIHELVINNRKVY